MAQKPQSTEDVTQRASDPFDINVLNAGGPDILIAPADKDFRKLCENEAFMHEIIEIRCITTADKNVARAVEIRVDTGGIVGKMGEATDEFPHGKPGVAGRGGKSTVMVLERGKRYKVPRYVFEVLAHSQIQTLRQETQGMNPEPVNRIEKEYSYHFECTRDDNPKGQGWREWVLQHAA